jgi:hypothetical protein
MTPQKSKFNVGDEVTVRCEEAGQPPTFDAVVIGVRWDRLQGGFNYTISEDGDLRHGGIDGYSGDWLTLRSKFAGEWVVTIKADSRQGAASAAERMWDAWCRGVEPCGGNMPASMGYRMDYTVERRVALPFPKT